MNAQSHHRTMHCMGLLVAVALLLSACQPVSLDLLNERHGRYYPNFSDSPYSGKVVAYYGENKDRVYQSGSFAKGLKEGVWTTNHWNGEVDEFSFEKGLLHGKSTSYYSNGAVRQTQEYQNGILHGQGFLWSADGRMIRHTQHEEGKLVLVSESNDLIVKDRVQAFAPPINLLADLFPPNG